VSFSDLMPFGVVQCLGLMRFEAVSVVDCSLVYFSVVGSGVRRTGVGHATRH